MARPAILYSALPAGLLLAVAMVFGVVSWHAVTVPVDISALEEDGSAAAWVPARPKGHDIAFNPQPLDRYDQMLKRPVFNKDRKPYKKPPPPPKPKKVEKKEPPEPPPPPVELALDGIILFEGQQKALIRVADQSQSKIFARGDTIEGWVVEKVTSNRVVLEKSGKKRDLLLYVD